MMRCLGCLSALCLSLFGAFVAHARPQPVAVWDGSFGQDTQGQTIDYHGNATSGGELTIDQSVGAVFAGDNGSLNNATFIIQCSGLDLARSANQYLLTVHQNILGGGNGDGSYNKVGVSLKAGNAGVAGIWNNEIWENAAATSVPLSKGDTTLVINVQTSGGVFAWELVTDASGKRTLNKVYNATGLKASGINYKGFTLGGVYEKTSSTLASATGWRIERLAVFGATLTEDEVLGYQFPSEAAAAYKSVLSLNFNASSEARTVAAGTDPMALVADSAWYNFTGKSGTSQRAGSATVSYSAPGVYQNDGKASAHLRGYFDDHTGGTPSPIEIAVAGLSDAYYDVYIYCSSDNSSGWPYKTINGTDYTWSEADGAAVVGTANWGSNAGKVNGLGQNVLLVKGVRPDTDGKITVSSLRNEGYRGSIAALQLCEVKVYTASVSADTAWSKIAWSPAKPSAGFEANALLRLVATGTPTITFDAFVTVGSKLEIVGAPVLRASDALYVDGCWEKAVATFGAFQPDGASVPSEVKSGFVGAYALTDTGLKLRAQNREVLSINIGGGTGGGTEGGPSPVGNLVPATYDYYGLAPVMGLTWNNLDGQWQGAAGTTRTLQLQGATASDKDGALVDRPTIDLSATAKNTYGWACTDPFLSGYLDDGGGVTINVHGVPYSQYDVIVYATSDTGNIGLQPISVNGTSYTYQSGRTIAGTDFWGVGQQKTAVFGKNALYVAGLTGGELTISAVRDGTPRATICAVQVICQGEVVIKKDFTATIDASTSFDAIRWNEGPFVEGQLNNATVTVSGAAAEGEVEITFPNSAVELAKLTVASARAIKLTSAATLSKIGQFDLSGCTGRVTYAYPVTAIASGTADVVYAGGAGTAESPVAIAHNGGTLNLAGGTFRLMQSTSGEATTARVVDSKLVYADIFGIGMATYVLEGATTVDTPSLVLSQDQGGRTAALTLKGNAALIVSGAVNEDSNRNSIMFGHWDGPSTFTIAENATFNAVGAQVLVGKTGNRQTINLDGGVFTTLGIRASAAATGVNALNLNGGELVLGANGIGSYGATTIAVSVTGDSRVTASDATRISQPLSVAAGKTLTLDATEGDITLSGPLSNAGVIRAVGGTVWLIDVTTPGTLETSGTGVFSFGYRVDINSCGRFRIPTGMTWDQVHLFDAAGNPVPITRHDDSNVYFDWKITGAVCWWDYEFDQAGSQAPVNTGTDGAALNFDGDRPVALRGNEYATNAVTGEISLRVPARPWRNVTSWPTAATFVTYGTMVRGDKTYQMAFGSKNNSGNQLILATHSVADQTVDLCYSVAGAEPIVLCTLKVPNAQTANHLYAFVLKTDDGGNTVVNTYLDGALLQPYVHSGVLTLGAGFQIASGHGGTAAGYNRPADDDPALMDWLRVYDVELTEEAMAEYAKLYPYIPPNGSYRREVSGSEGWLAEDAWVKEGTSPVETADAPAIGSTVKIYTTASAELRVDLSEDATYEAVQIYGSDPLKIVADGESVGRVVSSGRVTAGVDTTFAYDAFRMSGAPLTVSDGRVVTFDMTSVDLDVWGDVVYDLTGVVTTGANARVVCTYGEVPIGRAVSFGVDPADLHFKFRITLSGALTADLSEDTAFGDLFWTVGETHVEPDWSGHVVGTVNVLTDGARLTFGDDIASAGSVLGFAGGHAVVLDADGGVAVTGLTYDFTGLGAKATFAFMPEPARVQAGYVRYDVDVGTLMYDVAMPSAGGRYEFRQARIDGNGYDYHDRTLVVQEGDSIYLHDGTTLGCGLSIEVWGGELMMGNREGRAAIAYGRNGTRFNQYGGTVTVMANGTGQTGANNGFILSHSATGGGCHEFNVMGGLFAVANSSINFNEATNVINVSGTGVVRAKGVFTCKGSSTGAINVLDGGTLEIGSLGITAAAMHTFTLDGGTLRVYEDGARIESPVELASDSVIAAAPDVDGVLAGVISGPGRLTIGEEGDGGVVELSAVNTFAGGTTVASGTIRMGNDRALSGAAVVVADGGTLDYGGHYPANAVTASGTGANGLGAVVNTGAPMTESDTVLKLTLAADASVGGSSCVYYGKFAQVNLAGHTLTVAGTEGCQLALGVSSVGGGGTLAVGEGAYGTLATAGATLLPDIDLVIGTRGTLDLGAGVSLTCRDFCSVGSVVGSVASLVVTGTLDASAVTRVTNLSLADGVTLVGSGLRVSNAMTFGAVLYAVVPEDQFDSFAIVPESTVTAGTTLYCNGRRGYALSLSGMTLSIVLYSNNWLAYADASGVRREGGLFVVTNEAGLAWIASQAQDRWFAGDVALDADLDLSAWNWTPVARFTGSFDGRGHVIAGLNNTNVVEKLGAAGRCEGGPTNDWGHTAYGLFGSSTNAVFRNVTLADVAISNAADSVAALLGAHAGGTLEITGVTASGRVCGSGRAVAGVVCVGGNGLAVGDLSVTGNENRATVAGAIANAEDGGNVAQILSGTTWGTRFEGAVDATGNLGEGAFEVVKRGYKGNPIELPVCNLAAAVTRMTAEGGYTRYVEANDAGSVPVDPVHRTARMLAGTFPNGSENCAGVLIDKISASAVGGLVTLDVSGITWDIWDTVVIDRDLMIDLNQSCAYGLYDCDVFVAAEGVQATIRNGEIYYANGYKATSGQISLVACNVSKIPGDTLYDRTVPVSSLQVTAQSVAMTVPFTSPNYFYQVERKLNLADDWKDCGCELGDGGSMTLEAPADADSGFYRVRLVPAFGPDGE